MNLKRIGIAIFLVLMIAISFQNCSKVKLRESLSLGNHSTVNIRGQFCIEEGFHLKSFFITNS